MVNFRSIKAVKRLFEEMIKLCENLTTQNIHWLFRSYLLGSRQREAGFVLPTTTLLLVVVTLVTAALIARTSNRTSQVIGERQEKVITNAASPAIDRAKAKLEFIFNQDSRLPSGVPAEALLASMMLNDGQNGVPQQRNASNQLEDRYTLPGETRLNISGNGAGQDNVWSFRADTNGDGTNDATIAYSILFRTPATQAELTDLRPAAVSTRANALNVRSGPLSAVQTNPACQQLQQQNNQGGAAVENGWFNINGATLRKNFQVNAFVVPYTGNRTVATLELQQDRELTRGNKWGGWFRNDLEIFPGPAFNWNGALHTEGNLIVGDSNTFTGYLISAPNSCLYNRPNSEVTVTQAVNNIGQVVFQGQVVNGSMKTNSFAGSSIFHLFNGEGNQPITTTGGGNNVLVAAGNPRTDSLVAAPPALNNISIDPVSIFTKSGYESYKARGTADPTNQSYRNNTAWEGGSFFQRRRIYNQQEPAPYVDDTYRADNRYGPKPSYGRATTLAVPGQIGDSILAAATAFGELASNDPIDNNVDNLGLDGYWERRARREGLRVIVGQRLELGNPLGQSTATTHEARQRRTLRDNLAAVQATAIYHYKFPNAAADAGVAAAHNSGYLPVACLATTAHPGTATTINNSTRFNNVNINGTARLSTDFLTGNGTNGWEFNPPAGVTTEANFAAAIDEATDPLRVALTNLAHMAGDGAPNGSDFTISRNHFGAFPPRQDTAADRAVPSVASPQVHPDPTLTAWGNFSELRRVIRLLESGTIYANLSIADKSTLHTAACSLGMLAYNLDNLQDYNYTFNNLNNLNNVLINRDFGEGTGRGLPASSRPENYIAALSSSSNEQETARRLYEKEQIERDRRLGFANTTYQYTVRFVDDFRYGGVTYDKDGGAEGSQQLQLGCDLSQATGNNFFGSGDPATQPSSLRPDYEKGIIRIAASLCPTQPKYQSLYYLFPLFDHDQNGTDDTRPGVNVNHQQPAAEPYPNSTYIHNGDPLVTDDVNEGFRYRPIQDTNGDLIENGAENGIDAIALQPRDPDQACGVGWCLPKSSTATGRVNRVVRPDGAELFVPFLDKGMFNGREMMSVRVLDFDLDLLRRNAFNNDTWLPQRGTIYAFREDAVREDGITRPATTTWASCDTGAEIATSACQMNATTPQDPPNNTTNGITTKPVDYRADPERRPYGFRLRNGIDLTRTTLGLGDENNTRGISLISDNPVYIQGNFNLHTTPGTTTRIEEFTQLLNNNYGNFYTRSTLDDRFARPSTDAWRPVEILADAVTILSNNFCDGSIEDSFINEDAAGADGTTISTAKRTQYGCAAGVDKTSYLNQNRPNTVITDWSRENLFDPQSPIAIDLNGSPLRAGGGPVTYYRFTDAKSRNSTVETRVNAIIVSGTVPSQVGQSYGGMHNFPRFLEAWSTNLFISGSFLQLNFSTYATAPFDQESWEPGSTAPTTNNELINYYGAPGRLWGYDVGLQYAPAGPVARRFVTPGNTRSEFYRELAADDPYIQNLRCAAPVASSTRVDPTATCP